MLLFSLLYFISNLLSFSRATFPLPFQNFIDSTIGKHQKEVHRNIYTPPPKLKRPHSSTNSFPEIDKENYILEPQKPSSIPLLPKTSETLNRFQAAAESFDNLPKPVISGIDYEYVKTTLALFDVMKMAQERSNDHSIFYDNLSFYLKDFHLIDFFENSETDIHGALLYKIISHEEKRTIIRLYFAFPGTKSLLNFFSGLYTTPSKSELFSKSFKPKVRRANWKKIFNRPRGCYFNECNIKDDGSDDFMHFGFSKDFNSIKNIMTEKIDTFLSENPYFEISEIYGFGHSSGGVLATQSTIWLYRYLEFYYQKPKKIYLTTFGMPKYFNQNMAYKFKHLFNSENSLIYHFAYPDDLISTGTVFDFNWNRNDYVNTPGTWIYFKPPATSLLRHFAYEYRTSFLRWVKTKNIQSNFYNRNKNLNQ